MRPAAEGLRHRSAPKSTEAWPSKAQWNEFERARSSRQLKRLGIDPHPSGPQSQILRVLGKDAFAEFSAVRAPGKVIWCNFDLARQLGFEVPLENHLTPALEEQLLSCSLRAVAAGDDLVEQKTITMYADKYGGDGLGPALGAGRAGFVSTGNLYVKGVGITPLFRHNNADDFAHSHGGVHLDDCLVEAVFGEVNENLFVHGSCRILAVIDQGKFVTTPGRRRINIGIAVRAGAQLRPAHLLIRQRSKDSQLETFLEITRATGQLVMRCDATPSDAPDIRATMLRIIDDHARTAAESFRWRMIHGALSASNMDISGAMLDLPTQSTQPRTAPVWLLDYADSIYGSEHTARAVLLAPVYRKLLRNVPKKNWRQLNLGPLDFRSEMSVAYRKHLELQMLCAAGLKTALAEKLQTEHSDLANDFTELLLEMSAMKNRGSQCVARATVEQVAVLDMFNLLGKLPKTFFTDPDTDQRESIWSQLNPIFRGNRFHVAVKRVKVQELIDSFAALYKRLMSVAAIYANEYYGDVTAMRASIAARAAFENEPLDNLYSHKLFTGLRAAIRLYKKTADTAVIHKALDRRISASLRSVEALMQRGACRLLDGGGVELEMQTIDGINHSVKAWNDDRQTRLLHVGIPVRREGKHYVLSLPISPRLTRRQLESLRLSFRTGNWQTPRMVKGHLAEADDGGLQISFDIGCTFPLVGRLAGTLNFGHNAPPRLKDWQHELEEYVFAVPDAWELTRLFAEPISS